MEEAASFSPVESFGRVVEEDSMVSAQATPPTLATEGSGKEVSLSCFPPSPCIVGLGIAERSAPNLSCSLDSGLNFEGGGSTEVSVDFFSERSPRVKSGGSDNWPDG